MATEFTPGLSFLGGALIGLSAVLLLLLRGRIAAITTIAAGLLPPYAGSNAVYNAAFLGGLVAAPLLYSAVSSWEIEQTVLSSTGQLTVAGLLVGFGASYGRGCTSGHGVCGLSRLSVRSLVAVLVFMATAAITVFVTRHGGLL